MIILMVMIGKDDGVVTFYSGGGGGGYAVAVRIVELHICWDLKAGGVRSFAFHDFYLESMASENFCIIDLGLECNEFLQRKNVVMRGI